MRVVSLILALALASLAIDAAHADRRVAFVVGNGAYRNVAQLPNPPVDASADSISLFSKS